MCATSYPFQEKHGNQVLAHVEAVQVARKEFEATICKEADLMHQVQ